MAKYPGLIRANGRRLYTVRVKVPEHLQEIVAGLEEERGRHTRRKNKITLKFGPKFQREIWRTTGTVDLREAKRLYRKSVAR